ncbi:hypothetical protein RO3G_13510 [Rhizopus delemar RA 99-880]|uniref:AD domain-containing protein n=1 Tax=Rhizopus delemar (strain RA 99-880 / ATCC MYA-4621 / FGSC 9543 / NRRL 43880) TaxID=246409 RepID=I1CK19_RHIO9|nr:hypothetical protein RO3G_13510 [Rhizopus delemar RA 99-880]|eukprot:EIE88799.1 hypothetical protein RO3G_13510 [Rhizopus delemar RA 99-880]
MTFDKNRSLELKEMDNDILKDPRVEFNQAHLESRRHQLIEFFKKNRIPIEYDKDVIHVLGSADIRPPFVVTSVQCENGLIRKRNLLLVLLGLVQFNWVSSVFKSISSNPYFLLKLANSNRVFNRCII